MTSWELDPLAVVVLVAVGLLLVACASIVILTVLYLQDGQKARLAYMDSLGSLATYIKAPDVATAVHADSIRKYNDKVLDEGPQEEQAQPPPPVETVEMTDGSEMSFDKGILTDPQTGDQFKVV